MVEKAHSTIVPEKTFLGQGRLAVENLLNLRVF